ncbi:unnamed protein product [Brachionus calyciflorus]|uniref:RING-type domain-containing protein n=1 Tax=Brachionus calyciflorus TaxID=104777 RepID=A0A814LEK8_9BILA|nr:unnamed protein product [Brachionus calyciflorus]
MIFNIESLICRFCNKYFNEPKVLPCGESVCSKCLPEFGSFVCKLCSKNHTVSENDLPTNKNLSKILEEIRISEKSKAKIQEFNVKIEDIENKLNELKLKKVQLEVEVLEHCRSIISEIDLIAEDNINQINNIREDLIKEVTEYQNTCLNNLTKYSKYLVKLSEENKLLNHEKNSILAKKDFDEKLDKYYYLLSQVEISLKKIRNLSLDNRKIQFEATKSNLDKNFLGTISFNNLKKKSLNELIQPIKTNFSIISILNTSTKLDKLENGDYIFSYKQIKYQNSSNGYTSNQDHSGTGQNQQQLKEVYKFVIMNLSSNKILEIPIENKLMDLNIYTFGNLAFLMCDQLKYINKYDSNLTLLKTLNYSEPANHMLPTQKFVLVYSDSALSGPLMNIYDLDLNFLVTIKNNEYNSFLHMPNSIKKMFINDKYYFFQDDDNSITVVNQDNGTFFKRISYDLTKSNLRNIVKITNDFVIITEYLNTLEFRNSNGELSDEIEYDSSYLSFLIDDTTQIFLINNLDFQIYLDKF